jgi:hypothetical protein
MTSKGGVMNGIDTAQGRLGVPHLERLWRRTRSADARPKDAKEAAADKLTIHGMGVGLHETYLFLHSSVSGFDEFESWILERNGGRIGPERVAAVNANVARALGSEPPSWRGLPEDFSPVLDEADLACWNENGYVVLREAVPAEDCRAAERAIWEFMQMAPENPEGWYAGPQGHSIMVQLVHHPAFDRNRASRRIRAAFAQLWGTDDLQVTVDRGGFNPPERPGWPFPGPHLHWDTSIAPPMPFNIQGILYLTDTPANQGAFCCVPGFHRGFDAWLDSLPSGVDPRELDLSAQAIPIAGKAGDFVLWHAALPHGASPNRGVQPRIVQYISMYPPGLADPRPWR